MKDCLDENADRFDAVIVVPEDKKVKTNFGRDIIHDLSDAQKEYEQKMFPINIVFDNPPWSSYTDSVSAE